MFFKKKIQKKNYDSEHLKPLIRASICTGEEVAGFKDHKSGKFMEVMAIHNEADYEEFLETYDLQTVEKEY